MHKKIEPRTKLNHAVHCKTAEILEFYTLQNSWIASNERENE